jgi:hypothetical protein
MHKIISYTVKLSLLLAISSNCLSQTETFDIITYTPPKGFKKDTKNGVITYSKVNATSGSFCVIALYASAASTGDPQKDFKNDWNELVVAPFKGEANPKTETQSTPDGWKAVVGAALVKIDGIDVYIVLTVVSGFGKKFSIRSSLNEQSYVAEIDALIETMKLDKTVKSSDNGNNNTVVAQAAGSKGQFRLMTYTAPAGWSHQVFADGIVFKPLDLPAEEHLSMQIMQPLNFSGTLEQALSQTYDEAAMMYKGAKMHAAGGAEYEKKEAKRSFKGWEYMRCSGGLKIDNGSPYPPEYGLDVFIVKINNRYERVAILKSRKNCSGSMSRYYPDERPAYFNAIENFLFSLQFNDMTTPALQQGTINGDGIVGVWEGISLSVGATSTSDPSGVRYKVFSPIFLSNGQAYFGTKFPAEGLNEFNTWIRAENYRRDWGTYTFSNGRGVLKLPYGDLPLRIVNNKFIITVNNTDHAFHKLNSVDGARFDGTYVMNEAYEKIPVITFSADGRFTDNGAIKALYHVSDDCTNPGVAPGSGTYEVKDHSVVFNFSDGRKIKVAFLGSGYDIKNHSPATMTMGFNEDEMRRR